MSKPDVQKAPLELDKPLLTFLCIRVVDRP